MYRYTKIYFQDKNKVCLSFQIFTFVKIKTTSKTHQDTTKSSTMWFCDQFCFLFLLCFFSRLLIIGDLLKFIFSLKKKKFIFSPLYFVSIQLIDELLMMPKFTNLPSSLISFHGFSISQQNMRNSTLIFSAFWSEQSNATLIFWYFLVTNKNLNQQNSLSINLN